MEPQIYDAVLGGSSLAPGAMVLGTGKKFGQLFDKFNMEAKTCIKQMNDHTDRIENEDDTPEQEHSGRNTCPYCGDWDFEIDAAGNCANCGNTPNKYYLRLELSPSVALIRKRGAFPLDDIKIKVWRSPEIEFGLTIYSWWIFAGYLKHEGSLFGHTAKYDPARCPSELRDIALKALRGAK